MLGANAVAALLIIPGKVFIVRVVCWRRDNLIRGEFQIELQEWSKITNFGSRVVWVHVYLRRQKTVL